MRIYRGEFYGYISRTTHHNKTMHVMSKLAIVLHKDVKQTYRNYRQM